jgi:predicted amidophosphoribosyltransferase
LKKKKRVVKSSKNYKMSTLHLHIGSGKTGTTSIQELFHFNRDYLKKQGIIYPGPNPDHHFLFFMSNAPEKDWERTYRGVNKKKFKAVLEQYFSNLHDDLKKDFDQVISTEYLFISNSEYVENIVSFLSDYFEEIIVYVFVRDPISFFRSHQQQRLKARSYVKTPDKFIYDFKKVIETWSRYFDLKVIQYQKGFNSSKKICDKIGINFDLLEKRERRTKKSVSIEHLSLFEKVNKQLYHQIDDQLSGKVHLKTLVHIDGDFTTKPQLQEWVKPVIYQNHREDLHWLKEEYDIDFLNEELEGQEVASSPTFENGKATVRDVYKVPNEETVEKYEALVVDALLKKLVQGN